MPTLSTIRYTKIVLTDEAEHITHCNSNNIIHKFLFMSILLLFYIFDT